MFGCFGGCSGYHDLLYKFLYLLLHIEPDHTGKEDVQQPGGGDGHVRGAHTGLDEGDHGECDVRHEGLLEGGGGEMGATDNRQAVRGEGGLLVGTGDGIVRKDVNSLISSWEQLNAGGGGGGVSLQVLTGREGKEKKRQSQEFRYLLGRDASRGLKCSFASTAGAGTSPGPRKGRGAQRKLNFTQTKLSFEVIRGSTGLGSFSTNQKRARNTDSVAGLKVL